MKEKKLIALDLYDTCIYIGQQTRPHETLFEQLGLAENQWDIRSTLTTSLRTLNDVLSEYLPGATIDYTQYHELLQQELDSIVLFPETLSTLDELRKRGYKLAVVSNLSAPYIPSLTTHLSHVFDYEVLSCEVGSKKPNREIFDCLRKISGYPRDEIVMVGDSLYSDLGGARRAGIDAIHLNRDGMIPKYPPACTISTLDELLDIFETIR